MLDLKIVRIANQCSEQYLTFLLSQCLNIKEISLGINTHISDKVWSDVLVKNGMSKLEKIHIQKCTKVLLINLFGKLDISHCSHFQVTMHGIELLLVNCNRLKTIMDLTFFEGIHKTELTNLKLRIKEQNLDIEVDDNSHKTIDLNGNNFMNY
jgi:hypothetical protein